MVERQVAAGSGHGNVSHDICVCLKGAIDLGFPVPNMRKHYARRHMAPVAELVDAPDSKSGSRKGVSVRFRPGAPFFNLGVI